MEEKRTIGYICPKCGRAVVEERTVFALSASAAAVVCDCGKAKFVSQTDGNDFHLTVPCGICGREHTARVSAKAMLHGKGIALDCPDRRQLCCYIGEDAPVRRAMREMSVTAEKLRGQQESGETFADSVIMYEVLSELRDIAARGGISCGCGAKQYSIQVRGGAVDLICSSCGGCLRLPAVTDDDLDQLCCQYTVTIPGRKEKE